ncbi:class I SAM-dependent methyltransferase [Streptomyces sp. ODS28]|uniref:class I SAM-dependent methyltransferase n=1 Tax=Streptomyces sp. ODS28 TaxID=3136688 RepID=UPI0031E69E74
MSGHAHGHGHGHGHAHGHGSDLDWEAMAEHLEREAALHEEATGETLAWLRGHLLESGCGGEAVRRVLDVGAGPGVVTAQLARAFPAARVVAYDGEAALLERARARAASLGLADRVGTEQADLDEGFGALGEGEADLVWSRRVVHHLGDQQAALDGLARALRPGGLLALSEGGLGPRFLPRDIGTGRPGLQERLDAAQTEWFTAMRESLPGHVAVTEDWPAMLVAAGLEHVETRTFLTELRPPLRDDARAHVQAHLTRSRESLSDSLSPEDRETLDALLTPGTPAYIGTRQDTFYLSATTVHVARA